MDISVNDATRQVEIWLTHAEASSELTYSSLKSLFARYKTQGYRVAVFESGQRDLFTSTCDLLLANRLQQTPPQPIPF